jgi:hypothetical protein
MSDISASLHDEVVRRAGDRCEYCGLSQIGQEAAFHMFNPRTQIWREHFCWEGEEIMPLSPTGRATVAALAMNRPLIVAIRREETAWGRHPPE